MMLVSDAANYKAMWAFSGGLLPLNQAEFAWEQIEQMGSSSTASRRIVIRADDFMNFCMLYSMPPSLKSMLRMGIAQQNTRQVRIRRRL